MKREDYLIENLYTEQGICKRCGRDIAAAGRVLGDEAGTLQYHAAGHLRADYESLTYRLAEALIAEGLGRHGVIDELREFDPEEFDKQMTRLGT